MDNTKKLDPGYIGYVIDTNNIKEVTVKEISVDADDPGSVIYKTDAGDVYAGSEIHVTPEAVARGLVMQYNTAHRPVSAPPVPQTAQEVTFANMQTAATAKE